MKHSLLMGERYNCTYSRREIMDPLEASRRRGYVDQVLQDWRKEGILPEGLGDFRSRCVKERERIGEKVWKKYEYGRR